MTTINGVTFNMKNLRVVAVHRNSVSEQPGSDTNFITDMGYDGLVLRMEGHEKTLATYDSVISEFMKSGEQTLVYRTGWQFTVYSVQLTPELIEGIVDNYFPYDLILYTSTPYRESTTLDCRAKGITTNNQEWSAGDYPCHNLLSNWSLEDWSSGTSSAPDEWVNSGLAAIARDTKHKYGSYSAKLTPNATTDYLYHSLDDPTSYRNKTISFGCWCWSDTATQMRLFIEDGVSISQSAYHSGNSTWELLTVTRTIDAAATLVYCMVYPSATNGFTVGYIDGAVIIEGDSVPESTYDLDIDTDGSVDAVPDIKVTGVYADLSVENDYAAIGGLVGDIAWDGANMWSCDTITDKYYKHDTDMTLLTEYAAISTGPTGLTWDGANMWSCDTDSEKFYKHNSDMTMNTTYNAIGVNPSGMTWDGYNIWSGDKATDKIYKHNSDMTVNTTYNAPAGSISGLGWDGLHIWSCDEGTGKIYMHNSDMTVNTTYEGVMSGPTGPSGMTHDGTNVWSSNSATDKIYQHYATTVYVTDVELYNTADTTVKCAVSNIMLTGAVYIINADGTGTIYYDDDFNTIKWQGDSTSSGVTHDIINRELDIADDGYIYWLIDTKGPVTGIPTSTSQINITAGTPTIQISTDGSTWYDITTAIVDDVNTVYELDSSSLHLKGKTAFYWRIDCVKTGVATCSIKSFELDINIVTIDFEHPVITSDGAASTFRCDQDAGSGMDCIVALYYRGRSWPA